MGKSRLRKMGEIGEGGGLKGKGDWSSRRCQSGYPGAGRWTV